MMSGRVGIYVSNKSKKCTLVLFFMFLCVCVFFRFKFSVGRQFRCCFRTTLTRLLSTGSLIAATSQRQTVLNSASMLCQTLLQQSKLHNIIITMYIFIRLNILKYQGLINT